MVSFLEAGHYITKPNNAPLELYQVIQSNFFVP